MKRIALLLSLLALALPLHAFTHKIRISLSGGLSPINEIAGNNSFSWSPKIALTFPVSPKIHFINTEISIITQYESQFTNKYFNSAAFGFGIRVFYNNLNFIRPYFNHEILTRIVFAEGKSSYAKTFSVLLGLGIDVPLIQSQEETSSVFADISYVFYDTSYFNTQNSYIKTVMLTTGYSFAF